MAEKTVNYTDEMTASLRTAYEATSNYAEGRAVVEAFAESWGKTKASVTAKLVSIGVYRAKEKGSERKTVAKAFIVNAIEKAIGAEGELTSLDSANRKDLTRILNALV